MPTDAHHLQVSGGAWRIRRQGGEAPPPAHRPVRVPGLTGYVHPLGVRPGQSLGVHLTAPAAYTVSVARLGRTALLRPEPDDAADRAEAQWLAEMPVSTADRNTVYPGSYAKVNVPGLTRPATVSAWVRL
jgi:hypothetical protein